MLFRDYGYSLRSRGVTTAHFHPTFPKRTGPAASDGAFFHRGKGLISISTKGRTRQPVIVVGPIALKVARNDHGRACNRYEADLYRNTTPHRREMLCPVLWISPGGLLLIMRAAEPLSEKMSLEEYLDAGKQWGLTLGEDGCPFEPKASDWGWYKGRRVALDYSTPAWGND